MHLRTEFGSSYGVWTDQKSDAIDCPLSTRVDIVNNVQNLGNKDVTPATTSPMASDFFTNWIKVFKSTQRR